MGAAKLNFSSEIAWAGSENKLSEHFRRPGDLLVGCAEEPFPRFTLMAAHESVFHASIGNVFAPADLGSLAVLQYAVEIRRVEKILVCGHYQCTAVKLSAANCRLEFLGNWLASIDGTRRKFEDLLGALENETARINALCELNVIEQVVNLCRTTIAENAWKLGRDLTICGVVYDSGVNFPVDLNFCVSRREKLSDKYAAAISFFRNRWKI